MKRHRIDSHNESGESIILIDTPNIELTDDDRLRVLASTAASLYDTPAAALAALTVVAGQVMRLLPPEAVADTFAAVRLQQHTKHARSAALRN